ncbi:hypothetical protein D910_02702 [Dendroctonus ponderosae]
MGGSAWVTLATNDSYSLGALVLAHSLKQTGTVHQLAVLVTPGVTSAMREKLSSVFNLVQEVNILDSRDEANLRLLKRPELGITFTKLHCWRLTQFDKCVFLDADTLVLKNSDELFEREELSAAPDVGWPDCFNSGVFVYRPSLETYDKLIQFALEKGSFDGGDQGLLNLFFSDWAHKDISKHLPFIYNLCSTACYSYLPAFKQFGANAKIIHFIGAQKPWLQYFNTETKKVQPSGESSHLQEVLQLWWNIFCSLIHPHLSPAMAGLAGAFSQLTLGVARTVEQDALENVLRKQAWEVGNIDYLGKDSFENIWSKISETLSAAPHQPEELVAAESELPTASAEPEIAPAESQSQTGVQ